MCPLAGMNYTNIATDHLNSSLLKLSEALGVDFSSIGKRIKGFGMVYESTMNSKGKVELVCFFFEDSRN